MRRDLFGDWGTELTPPRFSAALAGLAAFGPMTRLMPAEQIENDAKENLDRSGSIVKVRLADIANGIALIKAGRQLMSAFDYAQLWDSFSKLVAPAEDICIELDSKCKDEFEVYAPDVFWVLLELERPGGAAGSAYLLNEQQDLPVSFELPFRFGVLGDPESARIAQLIDATNWRHLFKIIDPGVPILQCDMLILPFDLRTSASQILAASQKIEADCVIVMRGVGALDTKRALSLAATILGEVQTSGLVIASVPIEEDGFFLSSLVRELSHDIPLISVIPRLQQHIVVTPDRIPIIENLPVMIATHRLAQSARVREFARRLESTIRAMAPSVDIRLEAEADQIARHVQEGKWRAEMDEATAVVTARRNVERMVGGMIRVPRMGEDKKVGARALMEFEPEKPIHPPNQHHVVIDLYDVTEPKSRLKVNDRLLADRCYELELFIAAARKDSIVAKKSFPSEELPPGEHILSVHFVPLVRASNGNVLPSQHKKLKFPATNNRKACTFNFNVPISVETYRARLIISYRNRVLQTLILSAPVGDVAGEFLLDVENIVDPSFEKLSDHSGFDAAILVNDSPSGVSGVTIMQGGEAAFAEPEGLKKTTDDLREFITAKFAYPEPKGKFDSKNMRELIYSLSRKGKGLWDTLPHEVHDLLKDVTRRIQIVDIRNGAYFPAEFVYHGRSPEKDAKLCPNGEKALQCPVGKGKLSHEKCEHKDDPNFICPLRMWGFGLVIERQPPMGIPQPGITLRDVTHKAGVVRTDVFDRVVVSVSEKVIRADKNSAKNLVAALNKVAKKVSIAKNWKELKQIVANESPTLFVLLPHSGVDEEDETIPALELGGEMLPRDRLEQEFIIGPDSDRPILLLLGCDTNTAEIPFLNFTKRFKDCGAAMVMGTVTQIEALRTVDFVVRFIDTVALANKSSPTFGELLLETRRNMLAAGDGYALSLLAYGDINQ